MSDTCKFGQALNNLNAGLQGRFEEEAPELLDDQQAEPVELAVVDNATGYAAHATLEWTGDDIKVTLVLSGEELCDRHTMMLYGIAGIKLVDAEQTAEGLRYVVQLPADQVHDDLMPFVQECMAAAA